MQFRKDIQGLRAVAIIFVFLYHLKPNFFTGGFIGVDVFFVLSGFLITLIILSKNDNGNFSLINFYESRVKRIVPAYYFMLLIVSLAASYIMMGDDISSFKRELKHSLIFNSNYCYAGGKAYFGINSRQNPLIHTWSVAIEMKFYLLFPLLFLATKRKYLSYVVGFLFIIFSFYGVYKIQIQNELVASYYSLLIRLPEFAIGIITALFVGKFRMTESFKNLLALISILILLFCALGYNYSTKFPGLYAIIPCLATSGLLFTNNSAVNNLLSTKILVYIGTLSYSIYLWHSPIINYTRYLNGTNNLTLQQIIFIVIITYLLSLFSYHFIENLFRKKQNKFFITGILPIALSIIITLFTINNINAFFYYIPDEYTKPAFGTKSHAKSYVETFGDTANPSSILLIGNSHALCFKPYFDYIGRKNHFSFKTITTDSYPAIDGISEQEVKKSGRYGDFLISKELIPLTREEINKNSVIILVLNSYRTLPSVKVAVNKLIKSLTKDQHLILVGTFPILDKNPLNKNRDFILNHDIKQTYKLFYQKDSGYLMELVKSNKNVHFFDISKSTVFNNAPFYNDTLMYYNRSHINKYGAITLAKNTEQEFLKLINSINK